MTMKIYKTFILVLLLVLFIVGPSAAEWLGCDIPDPVDDVTNYAVIVDSQPEVIVPYQLNTAADAVLLWDITSMSNAHFSVYAINSQDRRSAVPSPFDLLAAPSGPGGVKIVQP